MKCLAVIFAASIVGASLPKPGPMARGGPPPPPPGMMVRKPTIKPVESKAASEPIPRVPKTAPAASSGSFNPADIVAQAGKLRVTRATPPPVKQRADSGSLDVSLETLKSQSSRLRKVSSPAKQEVQEAPETVKPVIPYTPKTINSTPVVPKTSEVVQRKVSQPQNAPQKQSPLPAALSKVNSAIVVEKPIEKVVAVNEKAEVPTSRSVPEVSRHRSVRITANMIYMQLAFNFFALLMLIYLFFRG